MGNQASNVGQSVRNGAVVSGLSAAPRAGGEIGDCVLLRGKSSMESTIAMGGYFLIELTRAHGATAIVSTPAFSVWQQGWVPSS
jgi:hypothetical protein